MDLIRHYIEWLPRRACESFARAMRIYPEFKHKRLHSDRSIRVVRLQRPSFDGLVHCTVEEVVLPTDPQEEPPLYDALSYCWWLDSDIGDARRGEQRVIICNGMVLPVYENLYNALLQLQRGDVDVPLWIDAICIDQKKKEEGGKSDNESTQKGGSGQQESEEDRRRNAQEAKEISDAKKERKKQINMMGTIFGSARKVIVWLGRNTLAMRFALWRAECFFTGNYGNLFERVKSKYWFLANLAMLDGVIRLLALRWIICKGWFSRVWTLQEMVLAKDLVFLMGSRPLDIFGLLNNGGPDMAQLSGQSLSHKGETNLGDSGSNMRGLIFARNTRQKVLDGLEYPIIEAMFEMRSRRSTRPHDKVFALFCMTSKTKNSGDIKANYDTSVQDVYGACAVKFLNDPQCSTFVLSMVGQLRPGCTSHPSFPTSSTRNLLRGVKLIEDLPSWVPDLTTQMRPYPMCNLSMGGFCAGFDEPASFEVSNANRFLHLKAARLDIVTKIGNCQERKSEGDINNRWYTLQWSMNRYGPAQEDFTAIWEVALELGTWYKHTDESVMSAFVKTLTGGETHFLPPKAHLDRKTDGQVEIKPSDFTDWFIAEVETSVLDCGIPAQYILHILGEEDCLTPHEQKVMAGEAEPTTCTIEQLKERRRHMNALNEFITRFDNDEYKIRERLKHEYQEIQSKRIHDGLDYTTFRKIPPFKSVFERHYLHRRHFCTRNGYIGYGPWTVQEGDVVMIVAGGYVPYIFRKPQPGPDAWELIGEAYCHGAMHGEAVEKGGLNFETVTIF